MFKPFIFNDPETGTYGYVDDKTAWDRVVSAQGSVNMVLDSRAASASGTIPTFSPLGQGITVRDWLGTAISYVVETSNVTSKGGGHNPGHHGCC